MRLYFRSGWAGGGVELEGDEAELHLRRRAADGRVLKERSWAPRPEDLARFLEATEVLGVWSWDVYYEPPYPVCGGETWALRLEDGDRRIEARGEDAHPPNWRGFLAALSELAGEALD